MQSEDTKPLFKLCDDSTMPCSFIRHPFLKMYVQRKRMPLNPQCDYTLPYQKTTLQEPQVTMINDPQCSLVKSKQNCSVSDASYLAIQEVIDIDMLALNRH